MPEGEASQEGAEGGGCHDPMLEHLIGRPCPQDIGVVDVGGPGHHGVHKGQYLAAGLEAAALRGDAHSGVHQGFEAELPHHCGRQQQPGIGDEVALVEGHLNPVDAARYWLH